MFHQIEGLVVGKDVTMAQLKGTLNMFVKKLFGEETKTKFRPHNFPFTEPSAEVDVTCFKCDGAGCPMCKGEGWIEILGAGMVHPNVLRNCGIDPEVYSGFAFGMGVDRITMLKYEIDDTGIGMAEEYSTKIFNAFEQLEDPLTRKVGGAGLGLAINKEIIEVHGGDISVESVPEKGSKFVFTIPLTDGQRD